MDAAFAMRDRVKARGFEVTGYVTRLDQGVGQQRQSGAVVITPTEGDARELGNVSVSLTHADYLEAIEAHKEGVRVHVFGTLERTGRRWTLSEPTGFERCADVIEG